MRVDKRRFERVVANLVGNAEHHGVGLRRETVTQLDGVTHLRVDDAGPGVPDAERERIFERFTRTPAADRGGTSGVGLGVALVVATCSLSAGRSGSRTAPMAAHGSSSPCRRCP